MLPGEDKLIAEAEETVVRRAVWSLPRPVLWIALAAILIGTYFFGGK
jgi:hypothetical protein